MKGPIRKKDEEGATGKKENQKKGFWKGLIEKLDKTMVEKANQSSCCCKESKEKKC